MIQSIWHTWAVNECNKHMELCQRIWLVFAALVFFSLIPTIQVLAIPNANMLTQPDASFYGGAGDQRGTGIAIQNGAAYISGQSLSGHAIATSYSLTSMFSPAWSSLWPVAPSPWPTVEIFGGVTATTEGVYFPGYSMAQTTDGVGGKEAKSVLVKYPLNGPTGPAEAGSLLAAKPHFFSYTGHEQFIASTTVVEAGTPFIYAAGGGQPCSYIAYDIAKFDTAGNLIASATDSSAGISFGSCYVPSIGGSVASGVVELNGNIYAAGDSNWYSEGDIYSKATIWKYDSNLNLIWRSKEGLGTINHRLRAVTVLGNFIYAVGMEHASAPGTEDYLIVKYDEAGNVIWSKTSGGVNTDVLNGITAVGGRLFAVGYTKSSGAGGADAVILEIDPATGSTLSTTLYGGALDDMANGVATDGTDLYIVGESRSFANGGNIIGQNDVMLLHYSVGAGGTCVAPPTGLVSWWDGDVVSGTTVSDIQGANHGTLVNGATTAPGKVGNAFSFDGVNDYISIPDSADQKPASMTVSGWFNMAQTPSGPELSSVLVNKYGASRICVGGVS